MKKLLMMLLILSNGCATMLELRKKNSFEPEPKPYYNFEIITVDGEEPLACLREKDTRELWEELRQCRGDK